MLKVVPRLSPSDQSILRRDAIVECASLDYDYFIDTAKMARVQRSSFCMLWIVAVHQSLGDVLWRIIVFSPGTEIIGERESVTSKIQKRYQMD